MPGSPDREQEAQTAAAPGRVVGPERRRRRGSAAPREAQTKAPRTRWMLRPSPSRRARRSRAPTLPAPESPVNRGPAPRTPTSPRSPSIGDKGGPLLCAPGAPAPAISRLPPAFWRTSAGSFCSLSPLPRDTPSAPLLPALHLTPGLGGEVAGLRTRSASLLHPKAHCPRLHQRERQLSPRIWRGVLGGGAPSAWRRSRPHRLVLALEQPQGVERGHGVGRGH